MSEQEPLRALIFRPPCARCHAPSATIEVIPPRTLPTEWSNWGLERRQLFEKYRDVEKYYLLYAGPGGGNGWVGDPITGERARAIADAFCKPYSAERIAASDFYDGAGFCDDCSQFFCERHWNVSSTGYGRCPNGHGKGLDPHWSPDFDDDSD